MLTPYRVTNLNRELAKAIEAASAYYFQPSKLMDAFGLAQDGAKVVALSMEFFLNNILQSSQCA